MLIVIGIVQICFVPIRLINAILQIAISILSVTKNTLKFLMEQTKNEVLKLNAYGESNEKLQERNKKTSPGER
jgi:hypothetical protein